MGRGRQKGGDKEAGRKNMLAKPRECGATTHKYLKVGDTKGGRKASGVAENPRGPAREWAGESS